MRKKIGKRHQRGMVRNALFAGVLTAVLLAGAGAQGTAAEPSETAENAAAAAGPEAAKAADTAGSTKTSDESADKEESVYVHTDASGRPKDVSVEVLLRAGDGAVVRDKSDLSGIRNTKGDETFTQGAYGDLFWENKGEDIEYKGASDKALPVEIAVTYFLDGAETAPEELAGKDGHVRIRFDYQNLTKQAVTVETDESSGGKHTVDVYVPFVAVTAVLLPAEHFSDIRVTNGNAVRIG